MHVYYFVVFVFSIIASIITTYFMKNQSSNPALLYIFRLYFWEIKMIWHQWCPWMPEIAIFTALKSKQHINLLYKCNHVHLEICHFHLPVIGIFYMKCFTLLHPLADLSAHFDPNSTSLGNIQRHCNYCAGTIHSHIPPTIYSKVLIHSVDCTVASWRTKMHKFQNDRKWESKPGSLDWQPCVLLLS